MPLVAVAVLVVAFATGILIVGVSRPLVVAVLVMVFATISVLA